jgi:threonine synthase
MAYLDVTGDEPSCATDGVWLTCIACGGTFAPFETVRYTCDTCDGLLEVRYADLPVWEDFEGRGVWRYAATLPFDSGVSLPEGATPLHEVDRLEREVGIERLRIKHEGMNPTGSFKDRGMTVGVRVAGELGVDRLACASTGNTSAALAAYGARSGRRRSFSSHRGRLPPASSHRRAFTALASSKSTATSIPVSTSSRPWPGVARSTC